MSPDRPPVSRKRIGLAITGVAFFCAAAHAHGSESAAARTIRVQLPTQASPVMTHLASVFARQVADRCEAKVVVDGEASLAVEFVTGGDVAPEGFRIEDRPDRSMRIVARDDRGLVAGAGKFLRTRRYNRGGFTPGTWRGTSIRLKPSRGIYFATLFQNFYHSALIAEIERYVEDLALWGLNELVVWYDMHHFNGFDEPAAVDFRDRLRAILLAARRIGMDVSLLVIGNEAYASSPTELRAAGRGRGGWYPCAVCPRKPNGMKYILTILGEEFTWASDLKPRSVWIWPYDQGGCACADCRPWGSKGFMTCVAEVGRLAREKISGVKIVLSTWLLDTSEWQGIEEQLAAKPGLVNELVHEPAHGPQIDPKSIRLPIAGFPEISMHGTFPWGGFGATPLTARAGAQWTAAKSFATGGFPYSEGIFEDLTKAIYSQLYWHDQPAAETVKEYVAFEFSPDVVEDVAGVVKTLEQNHRMRWWPGLHDGVPLEMNWMPSRGAKPQADPGAEEAWATMQRVDGLLTPQAKQAWRWRQLYLRTLLDAELRANGDAPSERCNDAFAELIRLYHVEHSPGTVRPPLPKDWKPKPTGSP